MLDNKLIVELDPHVQKVAEFMQANTAAEKLVAVANGVAALAPLVWSRFPAEPLPDDVVRLRHPPIR